MVKSIGRILGAPALFALEDSHYLLPVVMSIGGFGGLSSLDFTFISTISRLIFSRLMRMRVSLSANTSASVCTLGIGFVCAGLARPI